MVNIAHLAPLSGEFSGSTNVAPTGVSVATSSTGNYDTACLLSDAQAIFTHNGSSFSSGALNAGVSKLGYDAAYSAGPTVDIEYGAYLRATGATSYAWVIAITSSSFSGLVAAALYSAAGGYNSVQDATNFSNDGVGYMIRITHPGGRGGYTTPASGDTISVKLTGTATNSNGSTSAFVTTTHTWL